MKEFPKVLIACPTWEGKDYILERFAERVKQLDYPNYDILLIDNSKGNKYYKRIKALGLPVIRSKWYEGSRRRIVEARNMIREKVLKEGYDYYFSLEQDIIPPKNILKELLSHKKKIICGWYYINPEGATRPCLSQEWTMLNNKFMMVVPLGVKLASKRLMRCYLGSFGVCLIHRSVLEKIKFKVYDKFEHHDDSWFFMDCDKLKIPVWCDTDMLVPHFQSDYWSKLKR